MHVPILTLTSNQYAAAIDTLLGKGKDHARWIYQEWFREGRIEGKHPGFGNAQKLLKDICLNSNFNVWQAYDCRSDGITSKLLFQTTNGLEVETVLIPMEAGGTLCISSQVGCKMGCAFCETGRLGLLKQLAVEEIVSQVFYVRHILKSSFRNVVFMGMGEPFDNYEAVMQAFRVLNDPYGLNIGARHVTISTSGKVEEIRRLAEEPGAQPHLAVSINGATDQIRNKLMPINRLYPLNEVYNAVQFYNKKTARSVLIAYVLIRGINDHTEDAEALAHFLEGLKVKVNLIRYNPQSRDRFQAPEAQQVLEFKNCLKARGYQVLVRGVKGDQIMAACGQLGNIGLKSLKGTPRVRVSASP